MSLHGEATANCPVLTAISTFISQRSGINYRDYGEDGSDCFIREYRGILKAGRIAREMLSFLTSHADKHINWDLAFSYFSGRLEYSDGKCTYTTGQYFPTEYRQAACSVLQNAIRQISGFQSKEGFVEFVKRNFKGEAKAYLLKN